MASVNDWRFELERMRAKEREKEDRFGWQDLVGLLESAAGAYTGIKGVQEMGKRTELLQGAQDFNREKFDYGVTQDALRETARVGEVMRGLGDDGYIQKGMRALTGSPGSMVDYALESEGTTGYPDVPGRWEREPEPEPEDRYGYIPDYYDREKRRHVYATDRSIPPLGVTASTPYEVPDPNDPNSMIPATGQMATDNYRHLTGYGPTVHEEVDPRSGELEPVPAPFKTDVLRQYSGLNAGDPGARAIQEMGGLDKWLSGSGQDQERFEALRAKYRVQIGVEQYGIGDPVNAQALIQAGDAGSLENMQVVLANIVDNPNVVPLFASSAVAYFEYMKALILAAEER